MERRAIAKCISAQLGLSKSGNEQAIIAFDVNGQTLRYWGGFGSESQMKQTIKALRACGWRGDDLSDLSTCSASVELVIVDEEYQGKPTEKIRYVNTISSSPALAADRARAFAEKMKRRIASLNSDAPRGSRDEEPPPPSDSDMPF